MSVPLVLLASGAAPSVVPVLSAQTTRGPGTDQANHCVVGVFHRLRDPLSKRRDVCVAARFVETFQVPSVLRLFWYLDVRENMPGVTNHDAFNCKELVYRSFSPRFFFFSTLHLFLLFLALLYIYINLRITLLSCLSSAFRRSYF
uniref:Secreted protein n=1 Tax=Ixodes ricinus TaxID=34613 RepID=A0A6B0UVM6_IXORI